MNLAHHRVCRMGGLYIQHYFISKLSIRFMSNIYRSFWYDISTFIFEAFDTTTNIYGSFRYNFFIKPFDTTFQPTFNEAFDTTFQHLSKLSIRYLTFISTLSIRYSNNERGFRYDIPTCVKKFDTISNRYRRFRDNMYSISIETIDTISSISRRFRHEIQT